MTAFFNFCRNLPIPPAFVLLAAALATVGAPATPSADPAAATNAGGPRSDRFGIFDVSSDRRTLETLDRLGVGRVADPLLMAGRDPGRWLVVQIGNEVLPRDVYPPDRKVRFWHGTAEQYLWMLSLGYSAVKAVDRSIPVAAAGISSAALEAIGHDQRRIAGWNERLLTRGRFDWADVHLRHAIADIPDKMRWVRRFWSGPVAATEMAGPDPRIEPYSEALQAVDLVERLRTAEASGVDRLFWASLVENPYVARVHRREGLIERGTWRLKPAFDAYRHLIETSGE